MRAPPRRRRSSAVQEAGHPLLDAVGRSGQRSGEEFRTVGGDHEVVLVVNLMERLGAELGLSFLFIAHDLSVVKRVCDRVAVMYLGRIVEIGDRRELYDSPAHPCTRALLSAVPLPDPAAERRRERILLLGDPPSPAAPPSGCGFHPRCPKAQAVCRTERPLLRVVGSGVRTAACHFPVTD